MNRLQILLNCLLEDDSGQDLVEYALVLAVVVLGSVTALNGLSTAIANVFGRVDTVLAG